MLRLYRLALVAILASVYATPVEAATSEERCLSALRKGYAKVAGMEMKESGRCLAFAANAKLGFPPDFAGCSADDMRGKIELMTVKALATEVASCRAESLPGFALPDLDGEAWEPAAGASFSGVMVMWPA